MEVAQIVQIAFMLGVMFGDLTLGHISDAVGTKSVSLSSLLVMMSFGCASSYAPDLILITIPRSFVGISSAGCVINSFVLSSEIVGHSVRGFCGNVFQTSFSLWIVDYRFLAYVIHGYWRMLSLAAAPFGVPLILIAMCVPESRSLNANAEASKGQAILKRLMGYGSDDNEIHGPGELQQIEKLTMFTILKVKFLMVLFLGASVIVLGFMTISSVLLNLTLPETLNKKLPETLDDL